MDILFYVFAGTLAVAGMLAAIAIWAPRPVHVRILTTIITALFAPLVYVQFAEILSKPKPVAFEWYQARAEQAVVLGVSLLEGEAIYLWLQLPDTTQPRSYVMPWNLKLAERLEDSITSAAQHGSTLVIKKPFYRRSFKEWGSLNMEIVPPPLPPQKRPSLPPHIFNPREQKI